MSLSRALILFKISALYKSFTYLLTYNTTYLFSPKARHKRQLLKVKSH